MNISDDNFERITSLTFENGYREGYTQCLKDINKMFERFTIDAIENAEKYRIKNTNCGTKMDEEVQV